MRRSLQGPIQGLLWNVYSQVYQIYREAMANVNKLYSLAS